MLEHLVAVGAVKTVVVKEDDKDIKFIYKLIIRRKG